MFGFDQEQHMVPMTSSPTGREISDAYIYLLSRLLVLRQQQLDFKEGFQWNQLVHRKPGEVPPPLEAQ